MVQSSQERWVWCHSAHVQGPFSNEQMRYWFLDGFFDASSKVKASKGPHAGAFVPISAVVGKGKALESAFAMSG